MEVVRCDSLKEFLAKVSTYREGVGGDIKFRGHSSSDWELQTTLERYLEGFGKRPELPISLYHHVLVKISQSVSAFTEKDWGITNADLLDNAGFSQRSQEFMRYARHHGFPTPLLDWTRSVYVALFFAYQGASLDQDVAVFMESVPNGTEPVVISEEGAVVLQLGDEVGGHRRHFVQQSAYTVCVHKLTQETWFARHQAAYNSKRKRGTLFKYVLPGSGKAQVLRFLNEMNINAFTLYGDENSLMDMMAQKELLRVV